MLKTILLQVKLLQAFKQVKLNIDKSNPWIFAFLILNSEFKICSSYYKMRASDQVKHL